MTIVRRDRKSGSLPLRSAGQAPLLDDASRQLKKNIAKLCVERGIGLPDDAFEAPDQWIADGREAWICLAIVQAGFARGAKTLAECMHLASQQRHEHGITAKVESGIVIPEPERPQPAKADPGQPSAPSSATRKDNRAARHAEIGVRYRRVRDNVTKLGRVISLRRAQVLRLFEHRHGLPLPDNKIGRDALQVLLDLGLEGPAAGKLAPWMPWEELSDLIKMTDALPPTYWGPAALGEKFEVTFEETTGLRLHHIDCFDQPPHVVQTYRLARKAKLARIRRAKERARKMSVASPVELSPRSRAVLAAIGPEWMKIAAVVAVVSSHEEFQVEPPLKPDAVRKAVQRSVNELVEGGFLDRRLEGSGRQTVLFVRKKAAAEATK